MEFHFQYTASADVLSEVRYSVRGLQALGYMVATPVLCTAITLLQSLFHFNMQTKMELHINIRFCLLREAIVGCDFVLKKTVNDENLADKCFRKDIIGSFIKLLKSTSCL